jgi:hypothetical protein
MHSRANQEGIIDGLSKAGGWPRQDVRSYANWPFTEEIVLDKLPEIADQLDLGEDGLSLAGAHGTPVRVEAVSVPQLSELPALLEGERPAAGAAPLAAPVVDVLFRPEQEHGLSSEDDVLVPLAGGHGDVDETLILKELAFLDVEPHLVIAAGAAGINACVLL